YTRAFSDGPRNFEAWSNDEGDICVGTPSPNYHTNERAFQLSIDLTCIAALHGGSFVALGSNSRHANHDSIPGLPGTPATEEFLINGSILQDSKDLRLPNLIVKSEQKTQFGIFRLEVSTGAPHSKNPTKEHLFRIGIVAAMFQKKKTL
ncbi:hypothetical protein TNCV_833941, partial [Trichonephila clavipes]